jgi:hypothetical protein
LRSRDQLARARLAQRLGCDRDLHHAIRIGQRGAERGTAVIAKLDANAFDAGLTTGSDARAHDGLPQIDHAAGRRAEAQLDEREARVEQLDGARGRPKVIAGEARVHADLLVDRGQGDLEHAVAAG